MKLQLLSISISQIVNVIYNLSYIWNLKVLELVHTQSLLDLINIYIKIHPFTMSLTTVMNSPPMSLIRVTNPSSISRTFTPTQDSLAFLDESKLPRTHPLKIYRSLSNSSLTSLSSATSSAATSLSEDLHKLLDSPEYKYSRSRSVGSPTNAELQSKLESQTSPTSYNKFIVNPDFFRSPLETEIYTYISYKFTGSNIKAAATISKLSKYSIIRIAKIHPSNIMTYIGIQLWTSNIYKKFQNVSGVKSFTSEELVEEIVKMGIISHFDKFRSHNAASKVGLNVMYTALMSIIKFSLR